MEGGGLVWLVGTKGGWRSRIPRLVLSATQKTPTSGLEHVEGLDFLLGTWSSCVASPESHSNLQMLTQEAVAAREDGRVRRPELEFCYFETASLPRPKSPAMYA